MRVGPIPVDFTYWYEYDDVTRLGALWLQTDEELPRQRGTQLMNIYVLPLKHDSQSTSETVMHSNFLKCIIVDDENRNLLCEVPGKSLKSCLDEWRRDKIPIQSYTIPSSYGSNRITTKFLNAQYRDVVRQLYTFVVDQHTLGFSLTEFSLSDLWISDDELKVSGVGFIESTDISRHDDFDRVIEVLKEIVGQSLDDQSLPTAFADLVKKTRDFDFSSKVENGKLLSNHLAIIPPPETIDFIRACHSRLRDHNIQINRRVTLGVKGHDGWIEKFDDEGYFYVKQCYYYKGSDPNIHPGHYHQEGTHLLVTRSMLRFARNMAVHLRGISGLQLDHLRVETIIMDLFHEQLLTAQKSLLECDMLSDCMRMV